MISSPLSLKPQSFEDPDRQAQRHAFLKSDAQSLIALPSDASKRRYFRYNKGLLMDAPPPEEPHQFMRIADYLRNVGFSTPQVLKHDLGQGFLALEDFGDATYTRLLQQGEEPYSLYNLAVDTLIALHQRLDTRPDFIGLYGTQALLKEVELFVDWYMPYTLKINLSQQDRNNFFDIWDQVFQVALTIPHSLVLRDYHVDNLMRLPDRLGVQACGLLDFQDALWGPVIYDLVSLVEDARIDLEPELVEHCWQKYLRAFPSLDSHSLRTAGCILSAGRHTKIIGIFTRLAVRDKKTKYLDHLPRIWGLLHGCLAHPTLLPIKNWFEEHVIIREQR